MICPGAAVEEVVCDPVIKDCIVNAHTQGDQIKIAHATLHLAFPVF